MSLSNRTASLARRLPTTDAPRRSFRTRVLSVTGLIVGATLATAIGSTTLTGLILGESPDLIIADVAPAATQPAAAAVTPATQPSTTQTPIRDVLPSIAHASDLRIGLDTAELAGIDLNGRLIDDAVGTSPRYAVVAVSGAAAHSNASSTPDDRGARDAMRAAFDTTYTGAPVARPVTFGGSPDLVDAFRSFRAGQLDNNGYDLPGNDVVSDTVAPLGMDPDDRGHKPTKLVSNSRKPRRPAKADSSSDSLTWETGVIARPNGDLAPIQTGPVDGDVYIDPTVDPFDGGGRGDAHDGWTDGRGVFHPGGNVGGGIGSVMVPEPATLLGLTTLLGTLISRRRR